MAHSAVRPYYVVFAVLVALLVLTVAVAHVDLGGWSFPLALLIAAGKALLIILYFMHVRDSLALTQLVAFAGFAWLALLLGLTLTDYLTR